MRVRCALATVSLVGLLCHCGGNSAPASSHPDGSTSKDSGSSKPDATHEAATESSTPDAGPPASDASDADSDTRDASDASSAPDAFDSGPPVPCGSRSGLRGLTNRTIMVDGKPRTYLIYLPATMDPTAPMPFVFVFHGYMMSGQDMYDITQYAAIADAEGIGLAFPNGDQYPNSLAAPWNIENAGQLVCGDGQYIVGSGDDFGFIDAMKADVSEDQCLDAKHIFTAGFSMGAYFTHHVGCYRSDMRAIAPHSGGTLADLSVCTTGHVPVIIFHGTKDSVIDDACDDPTVTPDTGFPASANLWATKNGCKTTYTTLPNDSDAGGTGQCYLYDGCPADGQVEACTFNGMDHCWAGGATDAGAGASSACPTYASATQREWSFFKQYAW